MEAAEPETETDIEADADAGGSYMAASQVQDSFHESDADTDTTSKAATDPFQYEEQFASGRAVEKRLRRQTQMFEIFDDLVDNKDIAVDAYG